MQIETNKKNNILLFTFNYHKLHNRGTKIKRIIPQLNKFYWLIINNVLNNFYDPFLYCTLFLLFVYMRFTNKNLPKSNPPLIIIILIKIMNEIISENFNTSTKILFIRAKARRTDLYYGYKENLYALNDKRMCVFRMCDSDFYII